jgi:hypothetical protein
VPHRFNPESGTGYAIVDSTATCVLTRFRLRSILFAPVFLYLFRRVRKEAQVNVRGLIKTVLLRENLRTFYLLSIWTDTQSISQLGRCRSHVAAGNWAMRACDHDGTSLQLWSTQWRLYAISHNLGWSDVDRQQLNPKDTNFSERLREVVGG